MSLASSLPLGDAWSKNYLLKTEPGLRPSIPESSSFYLLISIEQNSAEENAPPSWPEGPDGSPKVMTCWPCQTVLPALSVLICKMGVTYHCEAGQREET